MKKIISTCAVGMLSVSMIFANCSEAFAADAVKEETVYVKTDGSGKEKSVIVSDQLRNIGELSEVKDVSTLSNISNVKGDETYEKKENGLIWKNTGSEEIAYQGELNEELPVGIRITYELDGKEISEEELKGKSGHLKMQIDYINRTEGDEFVPFLMVTALVADPNSFSNISVDHGRILSDGERMTVIGYGVPGTDAFLSENKLKEKLEDKKLEVPEGFTVQADVSDYESLTCVSMAMDDIFGEGDIDSDSGLDQLEASINELTDAANQLADGSTKLADGTGELKNAGTELVDGVKQLDDGGNRLAQGSGTLLDGILVLMNGTETLSEGTSQLCAGADVLYEGTAALYGGAGNARNGAAGLQAGLGQVQTGVAGLKTQAGDGLTQLADAVDGISAGIGQLHSGAEQLGAGLTQAEGGARSVAERIGASGSGADQLAQGTTQLQEGARALQQLAGGIAGAVPDTVSKEVNLTEKVDNSDIRTAVEATLRANGVDEGIISAAVAQIVDKNVQKSTTVTIDVKADTSAIGTYVQQLTSTADQVAAGAGSLKEGADTLAGGLAELETGAETLADSVGMLEAGAEAIVTGTASDQALLQGCAALKAGLGTMGQALNSGTEELLIGLGQLHTGAGDLKDGLDALVSGSDRVKNGVQDIQTGLVAADTGAGQLADGSKKLWNGASDLKSGAYELSDGLDTLYTGSGKLMDGVEVLDDGAIKLRDGMQKFNAEGIGEISGVIGNLERLLGQIDLMRSNAAAYKSCSGISEDMNGSVKFIFVTE